MRQVLSGVLAAGLLVAALFFLRFWRESADRLFGLFAGAFALMGANALALGLTSPDNEFRVVLYGVRLLAFLLIFYAIFDKNRERSPGQGPQND